MVNTSYVESDEGCTIDPSTKDYPKYPPLYLDVHNNWLLFNGTKKNRSFSFAYGDAIKLECSLSRYFPNFGKEAKSFKAVCKNGTTFSIMVKKKAEDVDFARLGCNKQPVEKFTKKGKCGVQEDFNYYEVGYELSSGYKMLYSLCFDRKVDRTIWSRNILNNEIDTRDRNNSKPSFHPDYVFNYDVDSSYRFENQRKTLAILLESEDLANNYITHEKNNFFSRGHLSPRADFIYSSWQDASYHYTNTAPQWQSFNARNWRSLEEQFLLELKNENNTNVQIFLHLDNSPDIPVPKLFWKALGSSSKKEGIIFFGVNNPFLKEDDLNLEDYILCTDHIAHPILDNIKNPEDIERGYIYTCRLSDVQDILDGFPEEFINIKMIV
ncbi:unnamed protein product [Lepeophtheirus salmonis]|uniref:(salmon louse) hypothetical protein n=1 Tax=Lepeophtheirus salmonis TaxID=72036 RepID=A0A7R8CLA7_LEPSM|nr:unnamed protein product [Lepeophtheirus salmonis]CAF2826672.1 unnamed protein product [Lepeophtheirus salmonis]